MSTVSFKIREIAIRTSFWGGRSCFPNVSESMDSSVSGWMGDKSRGVTRKIKLIRTLRVCTSAEGARGGRAREGVFPSRKWGSGDFPRENFENYALVICNHAFPPGPGNSGDFDFSEIKTTAMPLRCGDKNMVKARLFSPVRLFSPAVYVLISIPSLFIS